MSRALLLIVALVGCRYHGVFVCADDSQCSGGRCELTGYCSFADGDCPSGFRYGDSSGDGYANECVGEETPPVDAAIDAPVDAAVPFDVATCPTTYTVRISSTTNTSRYRLVVSQTNWWAHAAGCDDDLPGKTHLVIPETLQEIIELSQYIDPLSNTGAYFFVGAVQAPNSAAPDAGWILIDGSPLDPAIWEEDEPDDLDSGESQQENIGYFDKSPLVRRASDGNGLVVRGAVCECDGKDYSATARAHIAADPNNPN